MIDEKTDGGNGRERSVAATLTVKRALGDIRKEAETAGGGKIMSFRFFPLQVVSLSCWFAG